MKIALIGNPNCGKTTLFNRLTGSRLPVGNRAGVTVEATKGQYKEEEIFDLPGIYSLENSVNEESVSARFLESGTDYIINVVDATYLSRSLNLTSQLLAKKIPMTVLLNMTDKPINKDKKFDCEKLSKILGCPVVILKKNDLDFEKIFIKSDQKKYRNFSAPNAEKFAEFDRIEREVVFGKNTKKLSEKIDKILFDKYLAFPIFILIISAVLLVSSGFFGTFLGKYINIGIGNLSNFLKAVLQDKISPFLLSLLADGILTGVGGVLCFLPLIVSIFFFLTLLEECGYLSRVAVIFDKIFSSFGVSGRMAISIILGCGCTVPAVMSARTLDCCERKKCLCNVHFIPCSAKLPVLSVLLSCFFEKGFWLVPLFYIIGVGAVFLSLLLTKKGDTAPFILEIPPLQKPNLPSVFGATAEKLRSFLSRTCSVVFLSSVLIWFLLNFDFSFKPCSAENSILVAVCNLLKYVFYPIGLADWRIVASFLAGFAGKETVIGVLSVVGHGDIASIFTPFLAFQYAVFLLLSPPCAASLTAIKKELGKKDFIKCLIRQFLIAFAVCSIINLGYLMCLSWE